MILEAKGYRTPNAGCEGADFTFDQVKYPQLRHDRPGECVHLKGSRKIQPRQRATDYPGQDNPEAFPDESDKKIETGVRE